MLRLCSRTTRRCVRSSFRRVFSSSSSPRNPENPVDSANSLKNYQNGSAAQTSTAPIIHHRHQPSYFSSRSISILNRNSLAALSVAVLSGIMASYALISLQSDEEKKERLKSSNFYHEIENAVDKSNESAGRILNRMKQTGAAASVLWKSLRSVMSSANHEVRSGFELKVAALLADIVAASESRRAAIVGAGGGAVVDWLLETVAASGENVGTQAEAARALAYLVADPNVCETVLGRPHAVPYLLRFIFSAQPRRSKKQTRRSSFDLSESLKGRSMLVAAIMDVVTSNCDKSDKESLKPLLPKNAEMRDILAAIQVMEQGDMHWDDPQGGEEEEEDNGGKGMKGIGIKIIEGTTVLGVARTNGHTRMNNSDTNYAQKNHLFNRINENPEISSAVVPGLWDDLHSEHVAVPFAAWALANWAMSSEINRSHINELDRDGHAVMTALLAPERSVKWHASLVARLLLEDRNLPLNDIVSEWSSSLLSTVSQASKNQDIPLAQVALSAFLVSIERSPEAQEIVMEKGLHLMREAAKQTVKHKSVQEDLARALELLCDGELHISFEESQKWSSILLPWVFGRHSSAALQSSAINILSCILEDYGPSSIPISQGWLTIMLNDSISTKKASLSKGNTHAKNLVKTQIDQSNIVSATQIANQLAGAVVNLAGTQLGTATENDETFPLSDLLSLDAFAGPFKSLKRDKTPKINAAESAVATLRGIKALTEICAEDSICLNKIADFGVLSLIRRLLLEDDYEQLAAIEAYDASRALEAQKRAPAPGETSAENLNDSGLRVPPTAHIRRHAARLLTVVSVLPKVQKMILADENLRKWLEDCANGELSGCNDLKTQSYARATLLNALCNREVEEKSDKGRSCPRFADMIYLIKPDLPHWTCQEEIVSNSKDGSSESCSSKVPVFDVVFVHGLRGGPFKTWRLSEDKSSTKSGLVEKIDEEAGKQGTFWPGEWLSADFPRARMFSLRYKTNLTQWSGASLPLQEVSSMLLENLLAAGIGDRPVVFVTHSMGGLVVKQMLYQAKAENKDNFVNNTAGIVFYSCPHFGSRLADMPWRMGLVFRPAPTIGELISGSPRLVELNDLIRGLHKKNNLEILSFCETKVTPIVEGYGGWAFRMEIVPLESAYPGFGELVVLESTDHVNSCKPLSRTDPSYQETYKFMQKLKSQYT